MTANDMIQKQCIENGRIEKCQNARSFHLAETVVVVKSMEPLSTKTATPKVIISLVERGTLIMMHVHHALSDIYSVSFSVKHQREVATFTAGSSVKREHATVNLYSDTALNSTPSCTVARSSSRIL